MSSSSSITPTTVISPSDLTHREEELEALLAIYGEEEDTVTTSTVRDYKSHTDHTVWRIKVAPQATLELELPPNYPSETAPVPRVKAPQYILNDADVADLIQELKDLWEADTEVGVLWAEHARMFLEERNETTGGASSVEEEEEEDAIIDNAEEEINEGTYTYTPPTSKFGQPVRHFDLSVIQSPTNQCTIHHGPPFRPPKSGSSETLVAHVASVTSMDQVQWVLAELLSDKKIAKASHNMIAYKFTDDDGRMVSDNDDDGEKGSGAKLAALLELTEVHNVMVVVSRWYGGVHLGPARFKWFASVARDALEEFGYLNNKNKKK